MQLVADWLLPAGLELADHEAESVSIGRASQVQQAVVCCPHHVKEYSQEVVGSHIFISALLSTEDQADGLLSDISLVLLEVGNLRSSL